MRSILFTLTGLLCLVAVPLAGAQVELSEATGRRVTEVTVDNHTRVHTQEVLRLFGLGAGDLYSAGVVQQGLQLLSQKPEISNVAVHGRVVGADGIALHLEVQAAPLVRSVRFRGNRAVKDGELRSRVHTQVDRPLRQEILQRDRAALAERCAQEGYPEAAVEVSHAPWSDPRWVLVEFRVDEGPPRRIDRVEGPEDLPLEAWRATALLGLGVGDPASETRLRQGTRKLLEVLHLEGYPEARGRRSRFELRGGETVLVLPVLSGSVTDLRFAGVDEWQARTLRPLYQERFGEVIDRQWLDEVSEAMGEQLRSEGFHAAQVRAEDRFGDDGRRRITFNVERGSRLAVERVEFSGNQNFSSRRLRRYMSLVVGGLVTPPPFSAVALARDLKTLSNFYTSQGYLDARVVLLEQDDSAPDGVRLRIQVDEGKLYHYRDVVLAGDLDEADSELLAVTGLRPGMAADPAALDTARRALLSHLAARGRGAAEVKYRTEKIAELGEVRVRLEVTGGPMEYFGQIVVSGNVRTQTKVILRELTFHEGEPWNPEMVAESRRRIYRLGFFRSVSIEKLPAAVGGGVRDVAIRVEEQDAGRFTFGFGYGREEGLKGSATLAHTNLQGYGRSLEFRASADSLEESYAVNFREPWLFNRRVDLRLSLLKTFEDKDAYNLSTLGFQSALEKEFTERLRGSLLYTLSRNRLSSVRDPKVVEDEQLTDYRLSSIGPVLAWDSRDDPFNPRRGFYNTCTAEWALSALGSQVQFDRYTASVSTFLSAGKHTLALYAGGGVALKLGKTVELPLNKRFFLGGRNTVRGYDRDEIGPTSEDGTAVGGDTMVNVKAEWRYPVWRKLGGVLFWDAGNVWDREQGDKNLTHLRHGVGGGLRYLTPVGPLSLDVGWKIRPRSGEDAYAWHFTVGNVF